MLFKIETTLSSQEAAKKLSTDLVSRQLASCCNITQIDSIYFFDNKMVTDKECSLSIITSQTALKLAIIHIKKTHPYKLPKLIWYRIDSSDEFAAWTQENTLA